MKTTKAAFLRFAEDGLCFHGTSRMPLQTLLEQCKATTPAGVERAPCKVKGNKLTRKTDKGDSHLQLDSKDSVYRVGDWWLVCTEWETNLGEKMSNTIIYS